MCHVMSHVMCHVMSHVMCHVMSRDEWHDIQLPAFGATGHAPCGIVCHYVNNPQIHIWWDRLSITLLLMMSHMKDSHDESPDESTWPYAHIHDICKWMTSVQVTDDILWKQAAAGLKCFDRNKLKTPSIFLVLFWHFSCATYASIPTKLVGYYHMLTLESW